VWELLTFVFVVRFRKLLRIMRKGSSSHFPLSIVQTRVDRVNLRQWASAS
jgi:hypothetical protein